MKGSELLSTAYNMPSLTILFLATGTPLLVNFGPLRWNIWISCLMKLMPSFFLENKILSMLFTNIAISLQEFSPTVCYGMWLVCFCYYIFLKRLFLMPIILQWAGLFPEKCLITDLWEEKRSTFIGHYLAWPLFQIWIISWTDMSRPNYRLRFRGYVLLVICLLFRSQSRELSLHIALILLTGNLSLSDLNYISICKLRQWSPSDYDNMNFLKEDILKVWSLWEVSKFCCPGYVENATWFPEPMY